MPSEEQPKSVNDFLAILPVGAKLRPTEVVNSADKGEKFFDDFKGANIVNVSLLRYDKFDAVAFITDDRRAIVVMGKKESFVALEKRKGRDKEGVEGTLAFKDDVSHKRLDIVTSIITGENATTSDESKITKNVTPVDPASDFVQMAFGDGPVEHGFKIDGVRPSWWTEDWFTIKQANGESLTLRSDRQGTLGAFSISQSEIKPLEFGNPEDKLKGLNINQPPSGILPSRLLPSK